VTNIPSESRVPTVAAAALPVAADPSLTAPTEVTNLLTGKGRGTKVEELVFVATATTSSGLINVFVHDGTAYTLYDQILVGAIEIDAPTSLAWRQVKHYANLWLTPGWSLRISSTVAGNHVHVVAVGCDLEAVHGPMAPE
jgi:hypothetical protein